MAHTGPRYGLQSIRTYSTHLFTVTFAGWKKKLIQDDSLNWMINSPSRRMRLKLSIGWNYRLSIREFDVFRVDPCWLLLCTLAYRHVFNWAYSIRLNIHIHVMPGNGTIWFTSDSLFLFTISAFLRRWIITRALHCKNVDKANKISNCSLAYKRHTSKPSWNAFSKLYLSQINCTHRWKSTKLVTKMN